MAQRDEITLLITDAEGLIGAREFPTALERLRIAAETVPADHPDADAQFLRIRAATVEVARADPRHAPDAQAVWDIAVERDASVREHPEALAASAPLASAGLGGSRPEAEPWFFGAAEIISAIAIAASILSAIGGIVVGAEASKYTAIGSFGVEETHHHGAVVIFWIAVGILAAAAWMGLSVGLSLLTHIARKRPANL